MGTRKLVLLCCMLISSVVSAGNHEKMIVVRGQHDYPPMEFNSGEDLSGFHIDLIKSICDDLNIKVKFINLPWKRAIQWAYDGHADAISYIGKTDARADKIIFLPGNILSNTNISLVKNKQSLNNFTYNGNLDSLKKHSIVIPLGFKYGEPFDSFQFANKLEIEGVDQIIKLIATRQSVMAVLNTEELFYSQRNHPLIDKLEPVFPAIQKSTNYIGFSKAKGKEELAEKFSTQLGSFKQTKAYKDLVNKYGLDKSIVF